MLTHRQHDHFISVEEEQQQQPMTASGIHEPLQQEMTMRSRNTVTSSPLCAKLIQEWITNVETVCTGTVHG